MRSFIASLVFMLITFCGYTQDNYEIQVYGAQTVDKSATMFELHSNVTLGGTRSTTDGVFPTNNMVHETIEITHGFTDWFETGFYLFNAIGSEDRTAFVGSHIRPRVTAPEKWHWPLGLSLSAEVGYQKKTYCTDDVTLEIRPIADKKWRKWYWAFNPVFDKSLHGLNKDKGYVFSSDLKLSYNCNKHIALGLEYYGALGALNNLDPYQEQQHQLFFVTDLDWSEDWEFNAGYGLGFTNTTDNNIFKVILGYKLHKHKKA